MEEGAVISGPDLVDRRRIEIEEDGSGHVFAIAGLRKEGFERATFSELSSVRVGSAVGAEAVLKKVSTTGGQERKQGG